MSKRTEHGDNIANQVNTDDAYGDFNTMTYSDLWNILDQFQTHLMDANEHDPMLPVLSKWMHEIESMDDEVLDWI